MQLKQATHPGIFIKEELEERAWSQRDLAYILGCPEQSVTAIINGKRGITSEMAKSLAMAFDVSPEFFTNLQQIYDLAKAKEPEKGIATRRKIQSHYPAREMIKRGWLVQTNDSSLLEAQLAKFFEVKSFEQVPHLEHAAKKNHYNEIPPAQVAWLFRVKHLAHTIHVDEYREEKLRAALPQLRQLLSTPEQTRDVSKILANCGVRLIIVESIGNAKIDGVCFWLDDKAPVIGMSLRFDRLDNFWFVLRHEVEHVLQKDGKKREIIDVEIEKNGEGSKRPEEIRANKAAADFLVPSLDLEAFIKQTHPYYSEEKIVLFSKKIKAHPGIVIGQLQNRKEIPYTNFRKKFFPHVREFISETALTDGWGIVANQL